LRSFGRIGAGILLALVGFAAGGEAQSFSSLCQTAKGVCYAVGAPVGAPCVCGGGDPGRMIYAPPQATSPSGQMRQQQIRLGTTCGTPFGVCQIRSALPVGSPCSCYGPRGPDTGQIIAGPLGR
jgi:hypothetical protein